MARGNFVLAGSAEDIINHEMATSAWVEPHIFEGYLVEKGTYVD